MAKVRQGPTITQRVLAAIQRRCQTTEAVRAATGILHVTPYFTRLEQYGLIRKIREVDVSYRDRRGRMVNQRGYEWEYVDHSTDKPQESAPIVGQKSD